MRIEHGGNENPSYTPTCFGTQQKVRKWSKKFYFIFLLISQFLNHSKFYSLLNTNIPHLLSAVRFCDLSRELKQPDWIVISAPCFCVFDCCFIQQFHSTTPLPKLTRNKKVVLCRHCVTFCDLVECFDYFLLD